MKPPRTAKDAVPPSFLEENFTFLFRSILISASLLYILLNPQYQTGILNDDAVYVLGARSLWNSTFQSLILKPDYPFPGLPLLLAPWIKLVEPCWIRLEWIAVVVTALSVYWIGRWARQWLSAGETLGVVTLFAFNPHIAKFSGILMPAPFYTAAVILTFFLLRNLLENFEVKQALWLGLVLGWAALVRPEGIVLPASVLAVLVWTPQGRKIARILGVSLLFWGLVSLFWWYKHRTHRLEYHGDLSALAVHWRNPDFDDLKFLLKLLHSFLIRPLTMLRFPTQPIWLIRTFILLAVGASAIFAGYRSLWRTHIPQRPVLLSAALFSASYFGIHLFWHISTQRYVLPLLPCILICFAHGFNLLLTRLTRSPLFVRLALAGIILTYSTLNAHALYDSLWMKNPMNRPPKRTLAWIRTHTSPEARAMSNIASNLELYANRSSYSGVWVMNPDMFLHQLNKLKVGYLVYRSNTSLTPGVEGTEDPDQFWRRMHLRITRNARRFPVVYSDPVEQTTIYQVIPEQGFSVAYEKFTMANKTYQAGDLEQTSRLLRESLQRDPQLGAAYNLLGAVYWRKNDFDPAEQAFLNAAKYSPGSTHAMLNLATIYHFAHQTMSSQKYVQMAWETAAANDELDSLHASLKDLTRRWEQNSGLIFMDVP